MVLTSITTKFQSANHSSQPTAYKWKQKNQLLTISTVSGSHWLHNLTASFWSTSTFKIIINPLLGFYHLTKTSHLFLTFRRRSKKNQPFPFSGFAGFQNHPFPVLGSPWLPQSSISPFGISSTFTTVSLPFWGLAGVAKLLQFKRRREPDQEFTQQTKEYGF